MQQEKTGWEYRVIQHDDHVSIHSVSLKNDQPESIDPEELYSAQDKGSLINEVNFMINACAKDILTLNMETVS